MTNDNNKNEKNEICCVENFYPDTNRFTGNEIVEMANCLLFECLRVYGPTAMKIHMTYASKINPRDDKCTTVGFSKRAYEKVLEVELKAEEAKKYADRLLRPITLPVFETGNSTKVVEEKIVLYERSACTKDIRGAYWFYLTCTEAGKKYFFNIDKLGYSTFELENFLKLNSKYAMALYFYIETNRFRGTWMISVEELKKKLDCPTDGAYKKYKYFNNQIFSPAIIQVKECTFSEFDYEPIKEGTRITHIKFTAPRKSSYLTKKDKEAPSLEDNEFVNQLMITLKLDKESVLSILKIAKENNIQNESLLLFANFISSKSKIQNKVGYMINILKDVDFQEWIKKNINNNSQNYKNSFNDFKQSITDEKIEEMEKYFISQINKKRS